MASSKIYTVKCLNRAHSHSKYVYVYDDHLPYSLDYFPENDQVVYIQWRLLRYTGRHGGIEDWQRMAVKVEYSFLSFFFAPFCVPYLLGW